MSVFGKRDLNKAQTRLNVLQAVYDLSQRTGFRDLKVKLIADEAGITEMTFFNYFPRKEDVLLYMMGIWAVDLEALQLKTPLAGEPAIRRVFSHTADLVKRHPRLMVHFVASMLTSEITSLPAEIEPADRYLLYPSLPDLHYGTIPNGNEMLLKHLKEMSPGNHNAMLQRLASCFYGDMIVAHTAILDIAALYSSSLDLILPGEPAGSQE